MDEPFQVTLDGPEHVRIRSLGTTGDPTCDVCPRPTRYPRRCEDCGTGFVHADPIVPTKAGSSRLSVVFRCQDCGATDLA